MTRLVLASAFLLALCGCSGNPGAASSQTTPAPDPAPTAAPAAAVVTNEPTPTPAPAVATSGDAELEAAIRATAPDYRAEEPATEGSPAQARYRAVRVDLDGDGKDEVFVYLMGPYFCGSGGCNLLVFRQGVDGYSLLANIPTSDPPVILAAGRSEGHADFWRMQSGGGAPAEYVLHRYKGGTYVEASRVPAGSKPAGDVVLEEGVDFASGIVLEPRE